MNRRREKRQARHWKAFAERKKTGKGTGFPWGTPRGWHQKKGNSVKILIGAGLVVVLGLGIFVACGSHEEDDVVQTLYTFAFGDQAFQASGSYQVDPQDIQTVESSDTITTFDLYYSKGSFSLSQEATTEIQEVLTVYENHGIELGFVLMDLDSGKGLAYNIDETIYGASSFKGPYAAYVLQKFVETEKTTLEDYITNYAQGDSYYADGTASLKSVIYNAIVYSDNGSFIALREAFDGSTFDSWMTSLGIDPSGYNSSRFVFNTARNLAGVWMDIYNYLETETDTAQWFKNLLGSTQVSFIRSALESIPDIQVYNKGGWYADTGETYDSVTDCAIITLDGKDYLLCIITGGDWSDSNVALFKELAQSIFAARQELVR